MCKGDLLVEFETDMIGEKPHRVVPAANTRLLGHGKPILISNNL
jgi:hypothetical protein